MFYVVYYNSYIEIGKFVADAEIICCKEYSRRKIQEGLIRKLTTIEKTQLSEIQELSPFLKGFPQRRKQKNI